MTALFLPAFAVVLSACGNKPEIKVDAQAPAIPSAQYDCAEWPKPPIEASNSQRQVAAWIEGRVKPAFDDCKSKLKTAKTLNQKDRR